MVKEFRNACNTSQDTQQILQEIQGYQVTAAPSEISDDRQFDIATQEQIQIRDVQYSKLLQDYVHISDVRNRNKELHKWEFYEIVVDLMKLLVLLSVFVIVSMCLKCSSEQLIQFIPVIVTAFVTLATGIIAIPLTITKYLFSTKEDECLTSIISHTQEHDLSSKKILKDQEKEKVLDNN